MQTHIFFDLDGTLTDPELGITTCVQYALSHFGITVADRKTLQPFIGPPLKDSFMHFYGLLAEEADRAIEKYRERFSTVGLFENEVYPGVPEMLSALQSQGHILTVATSKPTVFAQQILDHFGLSQHFAQVCGSNLDGSRVRKGEVIAYAMEQNDVASPSFVKMVGDREHDILGAQQNGIFSIGVLYGYGSQKELSAAGADALAQTPAELVKLCRF